MIRVLNQFVLPLGIVLGLVAGAACSNDAQTIPTAAPNAPTSAPSIREIAENSGTATPGEATPTATKPGGTGVPGTAAKASFSPLNTVRSFNAGYSEAYPDAVKERMFTNVTLSYEVPQMYAASMATENGIRDYEKRTGEKVDDGEGGSVVTSMIGRFNDAIRDYRVKAILAALPETLREHLERLMARQREVEAREHLLASGALQWLKGYGRSVVAFRNGDITVIANLGMTNWLSKAFVSTTSAIRPSITTLVSRM